MTCETIDAVKSHTIPRCLLDQFAYYDPVTGSRRLWQYSGDREPWWKASPSTATRFDHHFQDPNDPAREERLETRLNQEIDKALALPDVKDKIEKIGTQVVGGPPEVLANHIHRELEKWNKVVTTMGIRVN